MDSKKRPSVPQRKQILAGGAFTSSIKNEPQEVLISLPPFFSLCSFVCVFLCVCLCVFVFVFVFVFVCVFVCSVEAGTWSK
jgi:hypothetical protein